MMKIILLSIICLGLWGCATYQPSNTNNLCHIFMGEIDWYKAARDSQKKWGTPIWVQMAIMHQESKFIADVRPEREYFLWIIPLPRSSSAYGFSQAQDPAWQDYQEQTGNTWGSRDNFDDAIDFIGWYTLASQKKLGISKWDAYNQYLAYHEGRGGYKKETWRKKPWLIKVANKVKNRASLFNQQLKECKKQLDEEADSWF